MKTVLLVEDNEADSDFIKRACEATDIPHVLHHVKDGEEAVDYLAGNNHFVDRLNYPLPDLVLLDVKMPRRNGHEVLEWVRAQSAFKQLPIIMLILLSNLCGDHGNGFGLKLPGANSRAFTANYWAFNSKARAEEFRWS